MLLLLPENEVIKRNQLKIQFEGKVYGLEVLSSPKRGFHGLRGSTMGLNGWDKWFLG